MPRPPACRPRSRPATPQARVSDEHTQAAAAPEATFADAAAKGEGTRTVRQTADELAQLAATERQQRRTS